MNRHIKKQVVDALIPLLKSKQPWVALESAKILCCVQNIWIPETGAATLPTPSKTTAALCVAKQALYEQLQHRAELKQSQNRRGYLRRKIKQLKEQQRNTIYHLEETQEQPLAAQEIQNE